MFVGQAYDYAQGQCYGGYCTVPWPLRRYLCTCFVNTWYSRQIKTTGICKHYGNTMVHAGGEGTGGEFELILYLWLLVGIIWSGSRPASDPMKC